MPSCRGQDRFSIIFGLTCDGFVGSVGFVAAGRRLVRVGLVMIVRRGCAPARIVARRVDIGGDLILRRRIGRLLGPGGRRRLQRAVCLTAACRGPRPRHHPLIRQRRSPPHLPRSNACDAVRRAVHAAVSCCVVRRRRRYPRPPCRGPLLQSPPSSPCCFRAALPSARFEYREGSAWSSPTTRTRS